jgi:hypothetical protein
VFGVIKVQLRIFYEDTDCGGVVYHSNYFAFQGILRRGDGYMLMPVVPERRLN